MTTAEVNVVASALRREIEQLNAIERDANTAGVVRFAASFERDILFRAIRELDLFPD